MFKEGVTELNFILHFAFLELLDALSSGQGLPAEPPVAAGVTVQAVVSLCRLSNFMHFHITYE